MVQSKSVCHVMQFLMHLKYPTAIYIDNYWHVIRWSLTVKYSHELIS